VSFREVLPFSLVGYETQVEMDPRYDPLTLASATQLLRLLKRLDVEQKSIAEFLDVTVSSVSMWARGHREVPVKHREALLVYVDRVLTEAAERLKKDLEVFPELEQQYTLQAFLTVLRSWELDVQQAHGFLQSTMQAECRWIGGYAKYATFTSEDRQRLIILCNTLVTQLETMGQLEQIHNTQSKELSGETPDQT
jgi:transcriptional regulator with XRE-family HTH domain